MTLIAGRSHPGRRGGENEDAIGWDPQRSFAFVADGMGGHASGNVASRIVKETLLSNIANTDLRAAVLKSHEAVTAVGAADERCHGMGSTVVAAQVHGDECTIVWAGDSRAYLWRRGTLQCLTRDHSYLELLRDQQQLTEEQIRGHPHKNLITQTLGLGTPEPSVLKIKLRLGDYLILCSDGLNDELTNEDIAAILKRAESAEQAVELLVSGALGKGGRDNVSVVIVEQNTKADGGFGQSASLWLAVGGGVAAAVLAAALWWWLHRQGS